jgi:hypothetical protein
MTTNRPLRVFLCHSSNDKPAVRELYQKLRAEPWIQPWLDEEELYPGQDWNMEIEKAVEAADAIIVCLSKGSITKEGYVQRELRIVLDFADYKPEGTIYILPVRLEECEPPRRLRAWQYADYFEGQRDKAFQRLSISLSKRANSLGISLPFSEAVGEKKETMLPKLYRREIHLEYKINADAKVINNYLLQHYTSISHEVNFDKLTLCVDEIEVFNPTEHDVFQYGFIVKGHSSNAVHGYFTVGQAAMTADPQMEAIPELFVITISQGQKDLSILSFDTDVKHAHMFTTELVRMLSKAFSVRIIS